MFLRTIFVSIIVAVTAWGQGPAGLKEFVIERADSVGHFSNSLQPAQIDADRIGLRGLIGFAYGIAPVRVQGPHWLDEQFRVAAKPLAGDRDSLGKAIRDQLGLVLIENRRNIEVLVVDRFQAPKSWAKPTP